MIETLMQSKLQEEEGGRGARKEGGAVSKWSAWMWECMETSEESNIQHARIVR
jgi:hypothetical protein